MSCRRIRNARRGYVMVFIAMMMLAFFGVAALVIDMGMVRLTQQQMQSATASASAEGLRFRDGSRRTCWRVRGFNNLRRKFRRSDRSRNQPTTQTTRSG